MTAMKRMWMVLVLAACGHEGSSSKLSPATCDALHVASLEARALREQVAAQLASYGRAMDKYEKLVKKDVAQEVAERDDYAGAARREAAFRYTAYAMCQASQLVDRGMLELALPAMHSADTRDTEDSLSQLACPLTADADANKRAAAAAAWSRESSVLAEAEDRLVRGCYAKAGGSPPTVHLAPLTLMDESP